MMQKQIIQERFIRKVVRLSAVVFVVAVALILADRMRNETASAGPRAVDVGWVDVHMHLDGVQTAGAKQSRRPDAAGDVGGPPAARRGGPHRMKGRRGSRNHLPQREQNRATTASADYLVGIMDDYGVAKAIVMPPPQNPNQRGGYDYTALLDSVRKYPHRLILGAGGGTLNPMIQGIQPADVTEKIRDEFRAKAEKIVKAGARVFGEMTALHTCMNPKHHYIAAPPDHPLFLLLADIAAAHDIPIDLHMEAVIHDIQTPARLCDACDKNPDTLPATIPAFERLLNHNPKARIVWQHIGWDNTGQMTPALLGRMLEKHANLYLAIKAVPEPSRENRIHDDDYNILPEWLKLFESFPNRIVIGADEFARDPHAQGGYEKPPFFKISWQAVTNLPAKLRETIGGGNARRIYGL